MHEPNAATRMKQIVDSVEAERKAQEHYREIQNLRQEREARESAIPAIMEEILAAIEEQAFRERRHLRHYVAGRSAFLAVNEVRDKLQEQGFEVSVSKDIRTVGMNEEGFGGTTEYGGVWEISW